MIVLKFITCEDQSYPDSLKTIKNSPKKLYFEGDIKLLNSSILSIIGSRACSQNGKNLAYYFAKGLCYQGITIASGLAVGIDEVAHQSTLQSNGKTIAVLGSGLTHIFPPKNISLYHEIIKNGGLVITEYPPEEKAKSQYFLERNRIISALSLGVLVIEASYRSGTSVTANFARQQGKKIFAIPHEITDKHGIGTNKLIQKGAKIVTSVEDIMKEFPFLNYKTPPKEKSKTVKKAKKICNNVTYNKIYQFITDTTISLNEIYAKSNETISQINNVLLMLEIEGYIKKVEGGYTCILEEK